MAERRIKQAFILGAGLGTRLRPITDTIPKVMVPIAPGKPLLEHQIEWLKQQGIADFIINVHYFADVITSYFGDGKKWGVSIRYSDEQSQLLETAGAIRKAEDLLDDDFLFMYGDELTFLDVAPVVESYFKNNALAVIVMKHSETPEDGDLARFDPATGKITEWHRRPHTIRALESDLGVNAGIYAMSKRILDYIPKGVPVKLDGEIIPKAFAAREPLYAFPTDEPILDIGRLEKYEKAKEYYKKRTQ